MLHKLWLDSSSLTTQEKTVPVSDSLRIHAQLRGGFSKNYIYLIIHWHLFGAQTYFPGNNSLRKDLTIKTPPKVLSTASYSTHLKCKSLPEAKVNIQSRSPHRIYLLCQSGQISHSCQITQSLWQVTIAMVALSIFLKGHLSEKVCCR